MGLRVDRCLTPLTGCDNSFASWDRVIFYVNFICILKHVNFSVMYGLIFFFHPLPSMANIWLFKGVNRISVGTF